MALPRLSVLASVLVMATGLLLPGVAAAQPGWPPCEWTGTVTITPANSPHTYTTYWPNERAWPDNPGGLVQKTTTTIGLAMNVRVVLLGIASTCAAARTDGFAWEATRSVVQEDRTFCDGLKRRDPVRYIHEQYDTVIAAGPRDGALVRPAYVDGQWKLTVNVPQPSFLSQSHNVSRQLPNCPTHKDEVTEDDTVGDSNFNMFEGEFIVAMKSDDPHQVRFRSSNEMTSRLTPGLRYTVEWDLERRDFVCGPDVTERTRRTLVAVNAFFNVLPNRFKVEQCEQLRGLGGAKAWDITILHWQNAGWLDSYTRNGRCCLPGDGVTDENEPEESCKHTVRHSGKCVLAGTLNYFLYGQMHRLCHDYARYAQCTRRLGACPAAGMPLPEEFDRYEAQCRAETGYGGAPVTRYELCAPDPALDPNDWDRRAMRSTISLYKTFQGALSDISVPQAFAEAAFDAGPDARPPVENRARCRLECDVQLPPAPFSWKWLPYQEGM